jgi:hypothetical protein
MPPAVEGVIPGLHCSVAVLSLTEARYGTEDQMRGCPGTMNVSAEMMLEERAGLHQSIIGGPSFRYFSASLDYGFNARALLQTTTSPPSLLDALVSMRRLACGSDGPPFMLGNTRAHKPKHLEEKYPSQSSFHNYL